MPTIAEPCERMPVALHPEGVDRNSCAVHLEDVAGVALHPEGVDRNNTSAELFVSVLTSPSTRRAWIEISFHITQSGSKTVALHPEGVDRNINAILTERNFVVALHPEGVDRNLVACRLSPCRHGRPPPGGRG